MTPGRGPPAELLDPPPNPPGPVEIVLGWQQGVPVSLDEEPLAGPDLIANLSTRAAEYGIGHNIHVGETALGIKGRIGFEAGAALILIAAHRELEKLVLTKWQVFWKDQLGHFYGDRLHEGHYFDPRCATSRPSSPARSSGSPARPGSGSPRAGSW